LGTKTALFALLLIFCMTAHGFASDSPVRLGLRELLRHAFEHNPALAAYYNNYEASRELYNVAGLPANPQLVVAGVNGTAPEDSNILSQTFEVFGKTAGRKKKALSAMRQEEVRYSIESCNLLAELSKTYIEALKARSFREVEEENVRQAEIFVNIAKKRYATGDIPYIQVMDSTIEYSRARNDLEASILEEKNALLLLFRLSCYTSAASPGGGEGIPYSLDDLPLPLSEAIPARESLRAKALKKRPELSEAYWALQESAAEKYLAGCEGNPDLILAAYRENLFNESRQGVRLQMAVPLLDWGTIGGQVKAAGRKEEASRKRLEDVKNRISTETDEAYNEVIHMHKRLDIINSSIIHDQEHMVEMLNRGYIAGLNSYLEVLEGRRRLRTIKKEFFELLSLYLKALVKLERATGEEIFCKEGTGHENK
jgi:outer membrane protein TolC